MIGQKARLLIAAVSAILIAFLLVGITYLVFPEQTDQMPIPVPEPSMSAQVFGAIFWIAITTIVAFTVVGTILIIGKIRRGKSYSTPTEY